MIQITPIRHNTSTNSNIRTHILTPNNGVNITVTIECKKENISSILEDHLLETISSIEWKITYSDEDFEFLTANYNKFIRNLDSFDLENVSIIISMLRNNILTISAIWKATAYLVEWEEISQIIAPEKWRIDFHTLVKWDVSRNASIYLSNTNIENTIWSELLYEFSNLSSNEYSEVASNILQREMEESIHLIKISHSFKNSTKEIQKRSRWQINLIKNKWIETAKIIKEMPIWSKIKQKIDQIDFDKNTKQKYIYIATWLILVFFLLTTIIQWITNMMNNSNTNNIAKEQIKQAQTLIEESSKLSNNATAFENNINEAEKILFELRNEEKYQWDIKILQWRIDALKKEMYDIQTISLSEKTSIIPNLENFIPKITFEHNNKLTIIGDNWIISDYVRWMEAKIIKYPNNDNITFATINENWTPFISTTTGKIITKQQNNLKYSLVNGSENWESSNRLKSFNGNLYSINTDWTQIYKYKSSANGFSSKTNVLPTISPSKILDIAIDGGFYIINAEGKIWRYLSTKPAEWINSLVLNGIPGSWNIDSSKNTEIIANEKLSYLYILNDKKIWIFQPNSRRFQDINALTYIGLIAINSEEQITNLTIPRDWLVYITTSKWVFEQNFTITDGKMILN